MSDLFEQHHDRVEAPPARDVYTVSRLNFEARALIESGLGAIWVEGEISNLARPRSGHIYFSLKDDTCQVRCAMFRMHNRRLEFTPDDGMHVTAQARPSVYQERGEFQLIVQHLEEAGAGALRRAFEALKQRLAAEGLFDTAHKLPLPALAAQIGVITSPTGAAIRDVLSVLRRRFPGIPVVLYPVPVQGAGAGPQIARTVRLADERKECDVLVLVRGGGSLEDLAAFNDETLARAIYACNTPLVCGVGHEIDFSIADFVADQRAATPSAAAELVTPDATQWLQRIAALAARLESQVTARITGERQAVQWLRRRLIHPRQHIAASGALRLSLHHRLTRLALRIAHEPKRALRALATRLRSQKPVLRVHQHGTLAVNLEKRLHTAFVQQMRRRRERHAALSRALETVSPARTLDRGYAIVVRRSDGALLRAADDVAPGDGVDARLARGRLRCTVDAVEDDER